MRRFSHGITQQHLLLFLSLLLGAVNSNTTEPTLKSATTTIAETITERTTANPPQNTEKFTQVAQNETSVTLQWQKVGNFLHYVLWFDGNKINVTASAEASLVEHTVPGLTNGTKYVATLFTVFGSVRSSGVNLTAVTAPENAEEFTQVAQNETSVTLGWPKLGNFLQYVLWFNGEETNVTASAEASHVEHTVSGLTNGTKYVATLFTVFESVRSSGVNLTAVTAPENAEEFTQVAQNETSVTLRWPKVGNFLQYVLWFNGEETNVTASAEASQVEHIVSELTNGTKYVATLFTLFESVRSSGVNLTAVTAPENAEGFTQVAQNETSVTLRWQKAGNFLHYVLWFNGNKINVTASAEASQVEHTVPGLTNGTKYVATLFTVFESVRSSGVNLTAVTAPENAEEFTQVAQNETSVTLRWPKVGNFLHYVLWFNGNKINVTASAEASQVEHTVSELTNGTKYVATLFTVFESVRTSGVNLTAVTAPENAEGFTQVAQNETSVTLRWKKAGNFLHYVLWFSGEETNVTASAEASLVEHTVTGLTNGTKYVATLFTVFESIRSSGVNLTAVTAPENAEEFTQVAQNETSVTLRWQKAGNFLHYVLWFSGDEIHVTASAEASQVEHAVPGLTSGTKYVATLFTVFESVRSSGVNLTAVTAPENAEEFTQVAQNETSVTLRWPKVGNFLQYVLWFDGEETNVTASAEASHVEQTVPGLTNGTKYVATLFTVFESVRSSGVNLTAVTAPENAEGFTQVAQNETSVTLRWQKLGNFLHYVIWFNGDAINVTALAGASQVEHTVSELTNGTKYVATLFTVFESIRSSGVNLTAVTVPQNADGFTQVAQNKTSVTLRWKKVGDLLNYVLWFNGEETNVTASAESHVEHTVSGLTNGNKHHFTLFTVLEGIRSSGVNLTAFTAPENAEEFKQVAQNETSVTLRWKKTGNFLHYVLWFDGEETNVTASAEASHVEHTVPGLTSGTKHHVTLFTVFESVRSSGVNLTAVTAPENVNNITVRTQNESSITLSWSKAKNIMMYILEYTNSTGQVNDTILATSQDAPVTHVVSLLSFGTKYTFTLFTVFEGVRSTGYKTDAATVPPMVPLVNVTARAVTGFTLVWENMNDNWNYSVQINGKSITVQPNGLNVLHTTKSLDPGTEYPFSVTTLFFGLYSSPYENFTVTAIDCASVAWRVTTSTIQGAVEGLFSNATVTNGSQTYVGSVGGNVSFTGLYPGATYNLYLVYEKNSMIFPQCAHNLTMVPSGVSTAHCNYWAGGYSVFIEWGKPEGVWTAVEVTVAGKSHKVDENRGQHLEIPGFLPARTYEVSISTLSGAKWSDTPLVFACATDPRGVIAGSVFAVLLFFVLVGLLVFVLLKRPDIMRGKKRFVGGSKLSSKVPKDITVATFPNHFHQLSLDNNRLFSMEYEDMASIGVEQTNKVGSLPENRAKNRYTNVLPYDWCRVKLMPSPNRSSDYINASYIPGYRGNQEYIATQGPLPSTVCDFWMMIWEQKVKGIVMVTNCVEVGRTKCEQYWPADGKSCLHEELKVSCASEQKELHWTLREFRLEHRSTSEERTVTHFHFTAWPDHGVPHSPDVLIQFRELFRGYIDRQQTQAPTVVHCSAGVGRTGTIIALDVLLQQLYRERSVGVRAYVQKMRQRRRYMVQTESQYVFLHQCIMDTLQPYDTIEENVYENTDNIYVNATALKQFVK